MPDGAVMIGGAQAPTGPVWMAWNFPKRCVGELFGARLAHRLGISVPPWAVLPDGAGPWFASQTRPGSHHVQSSDFPVVNEPDVSRIVAVEMWLAILEPDMRRLRVDADRRLWLVNLKHLGVLLGDERIEAADFVGGFWPPEWCYALAGRSRGMWGTVPRADVMEAVAQAQAVSASEIMSMLVDDVPEAWALTHAAADAALGRLLDRQARLVELLTCGWQAWQRQMLASAGRAPT